MPLTPEWQKFIQKPLEYLRARAETISPNKFYEKRGDMEMETIIVLPNDEKLRHKLRNKLVEYRGRIDKKRSHEDQVSTYYKIAVLSRVLYRGEVKIQEMHEDMVRVHQSAFNEQVFKNACDVISDYCRTGGANVAGGTGLGLSKDATMREIFGKVAEQFLKD